MSSTNREQINQEIKMKAHEFLEKFESLRKQFNQQSPQDENIQFHCPCCLLPIYPGDYCLAMLCCGSIVHISCLARIAQAPECMMKHECPRCSRRLTLQEEIKYINMYKIMENCQQRHN